MLQHYILADDDLGHINSRRWSENRIGFALQLCALRGSGRLLSSDEVIPEKVLRFISDAINRALAMVIAAQSELPMATNWGSGITASSDGQFFSAARQGEAMNLINARNTVPSQDSKLTPMSLISLARSPHKPSQPR